MHPMRRLIESSAPPAGQSLIQVCEDILREYGLDHLVADNKVMGAMLGAYNAGQQAAHDVQMRMSEPRDPRPDPLADVSLRTADVRRP